MALAAWQVVADPPAPLAISTTGLKLQDVPQLPPLEFERSTLEVNDLVPVEDPATIATEGATVDRGEGSKVLLTIDTIPLNQPPIDISDTTVTSPALPFASLRSFSFFQSPSPTTPRPLLRKSSVISGWSIASTGTQRSDTTSTASPASAITAMSKPITKTGTEKARNKFQSFLKTKPSVTQVLQWFGRQGLIDPELAAYVGVTMDRLDIPGYRLAKFMLELGDDDFAQFLKVNLYKKASAKGKQLKVYLESFATRRLGLSEKQFIAKIQSTLDSYAHQDLDQEQDQRAIQHTPRKASWQWLSRIFAKKPIPKEVGSELDAMVADKLNLGFDDFASHAAAIIKQERQRYAESIENRTTAMYKLTKHIAMEFKMQIGEMIDGLACQRPNLAYLLL
ncbi:hypothetical protein H4R35_007263, partial [Dimargaris xerosporica]